MLKNILVFGGLGCILGMIPQRVVAGPFADDMAKCLVNSTSAADKADLVRWIYAAMSLNPALSSMANVSPADRDKLTQRAAALFSRLMFQSCRPQVVQAVRNEGPGTITYAFQILGEVAGRGIMMDPHITQAMQALGNSIDKEKLKELLSSAQKQ